MLPISRLALPALALAALSASSFAQMVDLRGKVEDVSGTAGQFVVDCTQVQLTSAAFDLNQFVGQQVILQGNWNGSFAAPAIAVTALQVVPETFEIGGGAKIGDQLDFHVFGAPGDVAVPVLSAGSGFVPFGSGGTILIDLQAAFLFAPKVIPAFGPSQHPLQIPNDPSLIGVDAFGQAGVFSLASGSILLTNPDCKTIGN